MPTAITAMAANHPIRLAPAPSVTRSTVQARSVHRYAQGRALKRPTVTNRRPVTSPAAAIAISALIAVWARSADAVPGKR